MEEEKDPRQDELQEKTPHMEETEEKIKDTVCFEESEEEKIETEWAAALHVDFDAEEARKRAEKAATPPPMPSSATPPRDVPPVYQQQPAPYSPQSAPAPQPYPAREAMPDTYLVWSVLATVFCCFIPGIVAIVYSTMVSSKYYAKDYEGSRRASKLAQYWIIASVVLGVVTAAVYVPLSLLV